MKLLLGLLLQYAAIGGLVGFSASLAAAPVAALLRRGLRARPALRGDLQFLLSALPFIAAMAALAATAAPSVFAAVSGQPDHCQGHGHHLHLCLLHPSPPSPQLALMGAGLLATFLFRLSQFVGRQWAMRTQLRGLEAMGNARHFEFPLVEVPAASVVCHAAGWFRRRIFMSPALSEALSTDELSAALEHEAAHLRRRDPFARVAVGFLGLFALPMLARVFADAFAEAAEEACDADAAARTREPALVASALLKVAAARSHSYHQLSLSAFGERSIERRVTLLLDTQRVPGRALSLFVAPALAVGVFAALLAVADAVHHAVETALHVLN